MLGVSFTDFSVYFMKSIRFKNMNLCFLTECIIILQKCIIINILHLWRINLLMDVKHNGMNTISNSRKCCWELGQFTKKERSHIYIYVM